MIVVIVWKSKYLVADFRKFIYYLLSSFEKWAVSSPKLKTVELSLFLASSTNNPLTWLDLSPKLKASFMDAPFKSSCSRSKLAYFKLFWHMQLLSKINELLSQSQVHSYVIALNWFLELRLRKKIILSHMWHETGGIKYDQLAIKVGTNIAVGHLHKKDTR